MLEVNNITVGYADSVVIEDISFSMTAGRILAIVGANGAGKTTLLRSLNGTLGLMKGEILLDTKLLTAYSRRRIAQIITVIAQENETKFPVSVLDFVLAGRFASGRAFGWETEEDIAAAMNSINVCDLENYQDRLMNQLSGGERQRVILARALATGARILLLDEPTANLDLPHQALMFRLVKQRCKEVGGAAVVITHDLNLASEFADEILVLKSGRQIAMGQPRETLNEENLHKAFGIRVLLDENPISKNVRVTAIY